ncbi:hypothetical protein D6774_02625 [Candidatus Woesearchaeota archaeon]|nr:MAG: hypothetical protein D6774_02625 [Candidatus Woesearchaeota archaeon]
MRAVTLSIICLLCLVFATGCVQRTVVEQSSFDTQEVQKLNESNLPEKTAQESKQELQPQAKINDNNNTEEFMALVKLYNKTVMRRSPLALDYVYYNNNIGRKGVITKVYGDEVRLDLFKESSYDPQTNIEIVRFKIGESTGKGYCKDKKRCADTSKVFTVRVEDYPFKLPPDMREFTNGWVESSQYVKDVQRYYAHAQKDGKTYFLTIDGSTGFVIKAETEDSVDEWDELRVNRITMSDVDV